MLLAVVLTIGAASNPSPRFSGTTSSPSPRFSVSGDRSLQRTQSLQRLRGGTTLQDELLLSLSLLQAAVLGSLIGVERGWAGRPAGIRTMSMVAMGAALFTGVGKLEYSDSARAAAQVASGVGFIGAGVVQARPQKNGREKGAGDDSLKGLTTAAAIWLCAGVGSMSAVCR